MGVEWSDEPARQFEVDLTVTVTNARGTMAKVASVLATAEADIVHIHSGEDGAQETKDFYFVIAVRDRAHLDAVLAKLRRTSVVIRADRSKNAVPHPITSP